MASSEGPADSKSNDAFGSEILLPTTHEAAHVALFTKELLCETITWLQFRDVLAATGVCREWRDVLTADPNIRQKLFLKAGKVRLALADESYVRDTSNPIPLDKCQILGIALPSLSNVFDCIAFEIPDRVLKPHPGATLDTPNSMRHIPASISRSSVGFWRDMFITQPPCSSARITISTCDRLAISGLRYSREQLFATDLQLSDGIKLGDLYDIIHSHLHEDHDRCIIKLTICDWVVEHFVRNPGLLDDRGSVTSVKCNVLNGEVQRPTLPDPEEFDYMLYY